MVTATSYPALSQSGKPSSGSSPCSSFALGGLPLRFFDFLVIDECHRGGANDESHWSGILDYFAPAVQLGLTATPKRKDKPQARLSSPVRPSPSADTSQFKPSLKTHLD